MDIWLHGGNGVQWSAMDRNGYMAAMDCNGYTGPELALIWAVAWRRDSDSDV